MSQLVFMYLLIIALSTQKGWRHYFFLSDYCVLLQKYATVIDDKKQTGEANIELKQEFLIKSEYK